MLGSNLNIMSPEWTDVVFKNRNQAYGAYQLRKHNAYNTNKALLIATSIFFFALAVPTIINKIEGFIPPSATVTKTTIFTMIQPPVIMAVKPPAALPQKQVRAQHDMVKDWPPVVKPEAQDDPPTQKMLEKADPGPATLKGTIDAPAAIDEKVGPTNIVGEPTESPANPTGIFITSEVMPSFPGGEEAFGKFMRDHIRYPAMAKENGITGRVYIQFIVERDGSLTDMKILKEPGSGLGDEAARVLKISPRWKPGIQNGKPVRVQYTIPVSFSLGD